MMLGKSDQDDDLELNWLTPYLHHLRAVALVGGGFCWVCNRLNNGPNDITCDLDDIYFVKVKSPGKTP